MSRIKEDELAGLVAKTAHIPVAVTPEQVISWFASRGRYRRPTIDEVKRLTRLVNALSELANRNPNHTRAKAEADLAKARQIQKALRDLQTLLPQLIKDYKRIEPDSSQTHVLEKLRDAVTSTSKVIPYIFEPPGSGERLTPWHMWMKALMPTIERIWTAVGRRQLSVKERSPLIGVLSNALAAIDGKTRKHSAIASAAKRHRRRGAKSI